MDEVLIEEHNKDYLIHYGRLGMKWGRSIFSKKSSSSKSRDGYKNSYNKKVKTLKKNKYKDISSLSDQELQNRINRMTMERRYASLVKDQSYAVRKGRNKTDNMLVKAGKEVVNEEIKNDMRSGYRKGRSFIRKAIIR